MKLGLAPSNGSSVYGTHNGKVCRLWIGDKKMAKDSCDVIAEGKMSLSWVVVSL